MGAKIIKTFSCYPDMRALGACYTDTLSERYIRKGARKFIQGEIKRMAVLNHLVADILTSEKPRQPWAEELQSYILHQMFSKAELDLMNGEQKRTALVRLLFPKE